MLTCDADKSRIRPSLLGEPVVLSSTKRLPRPKTSCSRAGESRRAIFVAGQESLENHAPEATGGGDHALVVSLEQLPVDPRLVVVALEVSGRGELHQVPVARSRLRQQSQVVVELLAAVGVPTGVVESAASHRSFVARLRRHVRLGADDRVDPRFAARR